MAMDDTVDNTAEALVRAARVQRKTYLGDAVYAAIDRGDLVLTTEDGIRATNTIVLEPEVLRALLDYVTRHTTKGSE